MFGPRGSSVGSQCTVPQKSLAFTSHSCMDHAPFGSSVASHIGVATVGWFLDFFYIFSTLSVFSLIYKLWKANNRGQMADGPVKYVHSNGQIAGILTTGSFTHDKWSELMILFGIVPESVHRSPFSVVAATALSAHKMAKRSHHSIDEVPKVEGASSLSHPEGKRGFRTGCSATSEKLSTYPCSGKDARASRIKARHRIQESSSPVRNEPQNPRPTTRRLVDRKRRHTNLLTPGVHFNPVLSTCVKENHRKTFGK